ncbi:hypothetical protein LC087_18195 [Bacillus carboniphilus]|uniref:WYL domain-containing protein n=1 Tax=Bacillus carboniphilus TaxID=86663 RepID=A0ABY9JVU6_9BACI|nr:hypothetical protein [Bacillus carboniphilus]WLR42587.1 hypothetical protein LC087_18195 [Bacillus carboniphilus]
MNRRQLQLICENIGKGIIFNKDSIKEEKDGFYESYHQIEKLGNDWYYSFMNYDIRKDPEKKNMKEFSEENEAIKYLLLKILRDYYFNRVHPGNNPVLKMTNISELERYFKQLNVSDECYSFSVIKPQEIYAEIINQKMRISYIGMANQIRFSSPLVNIQDGIFEVYRLTYYLHFLKKVEKEFLQKNILTERFSDDDIQFFMLNR